MSLKTLINKGLNLFGAKLERTTASLGNPMAMYGIAKEAYSIQKGNIFFKGLDITIPLSEADPLLEGYQNALELSTDAGAKFSLDKGKKIIIEINRLKFKINDGEEFFILREVFLEGAYNLLPVTDKKIVLIDIGMNVGITSLFYAAQNKVEKVFSFEPFVPTFKMAANNLQLNEWCAGKIEASNFGLAKKAGELTVSYSLKDKGRMGLNGLPQRSALPARDVSTQSISLKPASEQFATIREKTRDHFIVCKIDCEGAEYEILDTLFEDGQISLPDVYFIEWHYKKPDEIVANLTAAGYHVINTSFKMLNSGMIYAIKNAVN